MLQTGVHVYMHTCVRVHTNNISTKYNTKLCNSFFVFCFRLKRLYILQLEKSPNTHNTSYLFIINSFLAVAYKHIVLRLSRCRNSKVKTQHITVPPWAPSIHRKMRYLTQFENLEGWKGSVVVLTPPE